MRLYDNDGYREEFMELVYSLLHSDETNERANQIIDAFDMAPAVDVDQLKPNDPLTLEELREMDGEPVWVEIFVKGLDSHYAIVHGNYLHNGRLASDREKHLLSTDENGGYGLMWLAYRRRPEEETQ